MTVELSSFAVILGTAEYLKSRWIRPCHSHVWEEHESPPLLQYSHWGNHSSSLEYKGKVKAIWD